MCDKMDGGAQRTKGGEKSQAMHPCIDYVTQCITCTSTKICAILFSDMSANLSP